MTQPPAYSDTLIDEVAATLPAGAPKMLAWHQIKKNRRLRADMARAIEDIGPLMSRLELAEKAGTLGSQTADQMELFADIEDFLAKFAAEPAVFDAWKSEAEDADIVALLAVFAKGLNVGEANSSST